MLLLGDGRLRQENLQKPMGQPAWHTQQQTTKTPLKQHGRQGSACKVVLTSTHESRTMASTHHVHRHTDTPVHTPFWWFFFFSNRAADELLIYGGGFVHSSCEGAKCPQRASQAEAGEEEASVSREKKAQVVGGSLT